MTNKKSEQNEYVEYNYKTNVQVKTGSYKDKGTSDWIALTANHMTYTWTCLQEAELHPVSFLAVFPWKQSENVDFMNI